MTFGFGHAVNDHLSEIKNQKIQLSNIKLKMSENTAVSFRPFRIGTDQVLTKEKQG